MVASQHGQGVSSLEDDRRARPAPACRVLERLEQLFQMGFAAFFREPDNLEEVIALGRTVGVVVDRFTGARASGGRCYFRSRNQMCIIFTALKGDAHRHLAESCCEARVKPPAGSVSPG